jgi:malonyl-CoA decarboxylase
VTGFTGWLTRERADENSAALSDDDRTALAALDNPDWWRDEAAAEQVREPLMHAAAWYFLKAKNSRGTPIDSVARFHLGNGARLERINWLGDTSERALAQGQGFMVNYQYDLDDIEENHEAYAENRTVVASTSVQRLARSVELVPAVG